LLDPRCSPRPPWPGPAVPCAHCACTRRRTRSEPTPTAAPAPAPARPARAARRPLRWLPSGFDLQVQPRTRCGRCEFRLPGTRSEVNRAMVAISSRPAAFGGNINVLRAGATADAFRGDGIRHLGVGPGLTRLRAVRLEGPARPLPRMATDAGRLRLVTPEQACRCFTATRLRRRPHRRGFQGRVSNSSPIGRARRCWKSAMRTGALQGAPSRRCLRRRGARRRGYRGARRRAEAPPLPREHARRRWPNRAQRARGRAGQTPPAEPGHRSWDRLLRTGGCCSACCRGSRRCAFLRSRRAPAAPQRSRGALRPSRG